MIANHVPFTVRCGLRAILSLHPDVDRQSAAHARARLAIPSRDRGSKLQSETLLELASGSLGLSVVIAARIKEWSSLLALERRQAQ